MSSFDANRTGRHDDMEIQDSPDFRQLPEQFSHSPLPEGEMVLVMSYVKRQKWGELFDPETALAKGTLFAELEKPFMGQGGCAK